jgi:hypothetical protein
MSHAIIADNFYEDPDAVRAYALRQQYYKPWIDLTRREVNFPEWAHQWKTTMLKKASDCPFKSNEALIARLETLTGETIDRTFWDAPYPIELVDLSGWFEMKAGSTPPRGTADEDFKPPPSALWNCCFSQKLRVDKEGEYVHTHGVDPLNYTGPSGWAGVVYLTPNPKTGTGLMTWRNVQDSEPISADHMHRDLDRWEMIDKIGNVYNRIALHPGTMPHSGGSGWPAETPEDARLIQTFFFTTIPAKTISVAIDL